MKCSVIYKYLNATKKLLPKKPIINLLRMLTSIEKIICYGGLDVVRNASISISVFNTINQTSFTFEMAQKSLCCELTLVRSKLLIIRVQTNTSKFPQKGIWKTDQIVY